MWQLHAVIKGRAETIWEPMSNFMALFYNSNSKHTKKAAAFNPFASGGGEDKGCIDAYLKLNEGLNNNGRS